MTSPGRESKDKGLDSGFVAYLQERRTEVERALASALPSPPDCPAALWDAMRYSLTAGGKRLRPILCLASAEAVGGSRELAMPAACAIELIHTYSLIHDDLPSMDNDTMRRGRPTLHVVAGEGMAILAGDGLLTEAFSLLARAPDTVDPAISARKLRVLAVVAAAAGTTGMVGGQVLDLAGSAAAANLPPRLRRSGEASGQWMPIDAEQLRMLHAKKTGALIRAAAVAGAIMGGGSDQAVADVDAAASELGLAFQIIDDILDIEGATVTLGKTTGKDAAAGKPTYPALYGVEAARRKAADCLDRAEQILRAAHLADQRLVEISRWIVDRSH